MPTSRADRQRRYRMRLARGIEVYQIEVPHQILERLIDAGRLTETDAADRLKVEFELGALLQEYASLLTKFSVTRLHTRAAAGRKPDP